MYRCAYVMCRALELRALELTLYIFIPSNANLPLVCNIVPTVLGSESKEFSFSVSTTSRRSTPGIRDTHPLS